MKYLMKGLPERGIISAQPAKKLSIYQNHKTIGKINLDSIFLILNQFSIKKNVPPTLTTLLSQSTLICHVYE